MPMLDRSAPASGKRPVAASQVAVLTGGGDRPYALGLAAALIAEGITFDFIGSDDLETPELLGSPYVRFLNLRGNQRPGAPVLKKIARVAMYYVRLIRYAATATPRVFHILQQARAVRPDAAAALLPASRKAPRLHGAQRQRVQARWQ
jgi:hypothetical protein